MQPQSLIPGTPNTGLSNLTGSSSPFSSKPSGGKGPLLPILVILLALGTVGFGTLTILFAGKANTATKTLEAEKAAAAKAATDAQKQLDEENYTKISESPYRSYAAPEAYGSFVVNFPKSWASSVDESNQGTQVNLLLNPEFVRKINGAQQAVAARIHFEDRPKAQYVQGYTSGLKNGKLKMTETKVSGQQAFDYTGTFSDAKVVREVVVPVRDKVLVFTNENAKQAGQFGEILSQAKIIP